MRIQSVRKYRASAPIEEKKEVKKNVKPIVEEAKENNPDDGEGEG